jgi:hypothetical protein
MGLLAFRFVDRRRCLAVHGLVKNDTRHEDEGAD